MTSIQKEKLAEVYRKTRSLPKGSYAVYNQVSSQLVGLGLDYREYQLAAKKIAGILKV